MIFRRIKPYKKGYLKVSDGHKLYYELCGNAKGKPVLVLHGGPGAGINAKMRCYFNPKVWNIILFDQRGAGKSKPFASTKANTTQKLVQDIDILLKVLKIKKVFLFGGSWGSTLALVYAIRNPEKIAGMLLRGIFLASKEEIDYFYKGGVKNHFPDAWERFVKIVPKKYQNNIINYYFKQMNSENNKIKNKFTYEWAYYEMSLLKIKSDKKQIEKMMKEYNYKSLSMLEAYYMRNNCFLPNNYILNNINKIAKIPVSIVHGRYDIVCPVINAFKLHKKLKNSVLNVVLAGHAASEPEIIDKLVSEMQRFSKLKY